MKNDDHKWDNKHPTAQMLGRWQPWHAGHQKLFEETLKKTGQVNIMVRDVKGVEDNPFDFENPTENTIMGYRVGYELSKGVSLIWDFRQFYRDDGKGKMETIQQTNIETTFNF